MCSDTAAAGTCLCSQLQALVAKAKGIPPMVRLLEEGPLSGRESAAGALWNLAMNEDNRVKIPQVRRGSICTAV